MLYSQVNYLGSFLPFNTEHCHRFLKPIEKFVNGNLRISSQRVFTEIKNGGLGLTKMSDFLNCQKCEWIPLVKNANEKWTHNLWDNATKTFIFKLHNNSLGYNLNVSKSMRERAQSSLNLLLNHQESG